MLLTILGAGASYDALHTQRPKQYPNDEREEYRFPLLGEVFTRSKLRDRLQRLFPLLQDVIPYLLSPGADRTAEDVLHDFNQSAPKYPTRYQQLMAVRLYLRTLITQCEEGFYVGAPLPTNHATLIDRLEEVRFGRERSAFVTFNYDRMVELALSRRDDHQFNEMRDYIAPGRYTVLKLHGSIDWARLFPQKWNIDGHVASQCDAVFLRLAQEVSEMQSPPPISKMPQPGLSAYGDAPALPALAVPLRSKSAFECPDAHLAALRALLPQVTAVLTVGWRAAEHHFMEELHNHMPPREMLVHCVSGTEQASLDTVSRLRTFGVQCKAAVAFGGGFSDYVMSPSMQALLSVVYPT